MDVRWGFITENLQSSKKRAYNARQVREQLNQKGFTHITKLYYLKYFRVTLKHCKEITGS